MYFKTTLKQKRDIYNVFHTDSSQGASNWCKLIMKRTSFHMYLHYDALYISILYMILLFQSGWRVIAKMYYLIIKSAKQLDDVNIYSALSTQQCVLIANTRWQQRQTTIPQGFELVPSMRMSPHYIYTEIQSCIINICYHVYSCSKTVCHQVQVWFMGSVVLGLRNSITYCWDIGVAKISSP